MVNSDEFCRHTTNGFSVGLGGRIFCHGDVVAVIRIGRWCLDSSSHPRRDDGGRVDNRCGCLVHHYRSQVPTRHLISLDDNSERMPKRGYLQRVYIAMVVLATVALGVMLTTTGDVLLSLLATALVVATMSILALLVFLTIVILTMLSVDDDEWRETRGE